MSARPKIRIYKNKLGKQYIKSKRLKKRFYFNDRQELLKIIKWLAKYHSNTNQRNPERKRVKSSTSTNKRPRLRRSTYKQKASHYDQATPQTNNNWEKLQSTTQQKIDELEKLKTKVEKNQLALPPAENSNIANYRPNQQSSHPNPPPQGKKAQLLQLSEKEVDDLFNYYRNVLLQKEQEKLQEEQQKRDIEIELGKQKSLEVDKLAKELIAQDYPSTKGNLKKLASKSFPDLSSAQLSKLKSYEIRNLLIQKGVIDLEKYRNKAKSELGKRTVEDDNKNNQIDITPKKLTKEEKIEAMQQGKIRKRLEKEANKELESPDISDQDKDLPLSGEDVKDTANRIIKSMYSSANESERDTPIKKNKDDD